MNMLKKFMVVGLIFGFSLNTMQACGKRVLPKLMVLAVITQGAAAQQIAAPDNALVAQASSFRMAAAQNPSFALNCVEMSFRKEGAGYGHKLKTPLCAPMDPNVAGAVFKNLCKVDKTIYVDQKPASCFGIMGKVGGIARATWECIYDLTYATAEMIEACNG